MIPSALAQTYYDRILEAHTGNEGAPKNAVRDLRPLFENIFRQLTESERRGFSNVYARTEFVIRNRQVPPAITQRIHGFRRFANRVVHEMSSEVSDEGYACCLEAMALIVRHFSGEEVPEALRLLYEGRTGQGFRAPEQPSGELHDGVRCVVLEVGDLQHADNGTPFFRMRCSDTGSDLGEFSLTLWQSPLNDLSALQSLVWPYAILQVHRMRRFPNRQDAWSSVPETQVILEPDLLVDATDIADCFQESGPNAYLFFLNKLTPSESGITAFRGNLVNELLDRILLDPAAPVDEVLREAMAGKALSAARYGSRELGDHLEIIRSAHLPNLKEVGNTYRGRPIRIEPTFVSAAYGLQGRLDALIEDSDDPNKKEVFELKSGKPPRGEQVWANNRAQVVCYHLLLRSAFGVNRHGQCAVFYSAAEGIPLRDVAANARGEAQVQLVRNRVVRGICDLANGQMWLLGVMNPDRIGNFPPYAATTLGSLHAALRDADPLSRAWYEHFLAFTLRELLTAKVGGPGEEDRIGNGYSALWLEQREEKARHYAILDGLTIRSYDPATGTMVLKIPGNLDHNFREGDIGIIYRDKDLFLNPLGDQILKGSIRSLGSDEVTFALRNRQVDPRNFVPGSRWAIEHDMQDTNYWTQAQGLLDILRAQPARRELLFGLREPRREALDPIEAPGMAEDQRIPLQRILEAKDYFLLQGPPGTGKTSTLLVQAVRRLLEGGEDKIVLLAFTNRAVNEIRSKLEAQGIPFLYLGNHQDGATVSLGSIALERGPDAVREHIAGHRVYLSTVSGFANRVADLAAITPLDIAIVDEASQLTEPALAGLLTKFRKFVLIGDQNQLPAVVSQPEPRCRIEQEHLQTAGFRNLGESLFARLYRQARQKGWDHATGMLETHFRMHEEIADLVNEAYDGRLRSGTDRQRAPFTVFDPASADPLQALLSASRTLYIPCAREVSAKTNKQEAERVVALLKSIRQAYGERFDERTVGVVTPWRAQIVLIRSMIDDPEIRDKVLIDTVERFQGMERRHILASLAIYHPGQLQSLQSPDPEGRVDRKLLVTLSRAEEQVVLLGNIPVLRQSPWYGRVLDAMQEARWPA